MANSTYLNASLSGPPKYFQTSQGDGSLSGPFIPSVAIVDGSGAQITSFGGGTQYADGATQATPTGTVALGKNGSNILHALSLDGSGYLNVNVAAGGASGGTSSNFGAAFPATGTASGFSDGTNMQTARVFDGDTGAGTEYNMGVILRKSGSGGTVEAGTSTNPLRTDPTGTTAQPVSGTITANIGTAGSLALDATLTGGTQKAIARGGAKGSTSAADVTSTASGSNHQALDVVIYDTSGNPITSFGGAGGTSMTDDAAFTPGTTAITPVGGTYRSTRDTVDDNDAGAFAITQRRALLACLETPNGDSAMDDTNDAVKTVLATVPNVTNAGTFAVQESGGALTSLQLIDDAIVADDAAFTPATTKVMMAGFEFDDTSPDSVNEGDAGAARMSANRNIYTTLRDAAGNERGLNISANNAAAIAGDVAHDAADSGNPLKCGGVARTTNPTAVADGDRVNCFRDDVGRQISVLNQVRDLMAVQQTTITSSTSETTIVTAAGSGVFADLTQLTITNSSATGLIVTLKDSTGGTTRGIYALAANGGITISFPTPLPQATANNNWTLTCGTSVASIYVVAEYAKNV